MTNKIIKPTPKQTIAAVKSGDFSTVDTIEEKARKEVYDILDSFTAEKLKNLIFK